jgi:hypothetical protein
VRYRAAAPVELVYVHAKQALLAAVNREQSSKEVRGRGGTRLTATCVAAGQPSILGGRKKDLYVRRTRGGTPS